MEAQPQTKTLFNDRALIEQCKKKPELISLNEIYQEDSPSTCGYCHKQNTSYSWSFTKKQMQPYTYQLLMERGWRRCGNYYYKPNLNKSCCQLFTHRLEVEKFRIKKDQKKTIKKVITLAYEKVEKMEHDQKGKKDIKNKKEKEKQLKHQKTTKIIQQIKETTKKELTQICHRMTDYLKQKLSNMIKGFGVDLNIFNQFTYNFEDKLKFFVSKPGEQYNYYSNYVMLLFGVNKKLLQGSKYSLIDFSKDVKIGIEGFGSINGYQLQVERGGYLLFKVLGDQTKQYEVLAEDEIQKQEQKIVMEKHQTNKQEKVEKGGIINNLLQTIKNKFKGSESLQSRDPQDLKLHQKHSSGNFQLLKPEHEYKGELTITSNKITFGKLVIDIVPADQNEESFKIYQKYTKDIHQKKQKSMSSYVNFLCLQALNKGVQKSSIPQQAKQYYIPSYDSTEKYQKRKSTGTSILKFLGCYHMKYYLDDKLIAVGVVDIVNDGLSSVYFFYDPEFKQYRLGVFSSVIEIQYIRWMRLSFPEFRYYYMGFYISNCEKMNYKIDYMPCQLLCPVTYLFVDLDERVKIKTDMIANGKQKNFRLALDEQKIIEDMNFGKDMGPYIDHHIKLLYNNRVLILKEINPQFYLHILKIIKINLPVWGKKIYEILTFTL